MAMMHAIRRKEKPKASDMDDSLPASTKSLWELCTACWHDTPTERWPMSRVVNYLSSGGDSTARSIEDSCSTIDLSIDDEIMKRRPRTPSTSDVNMQNSIRREQADHSENSGSHPTESTYTQDETAASYTKAALRKMDDRNWEEAVEALLAAIKLRKQLSGGIPMDTNGISLARDYKNQSFCLEKMGRHDLALEAARKALELWIILSRRDSSLLLELGTSYYTVGLLSKKECNANKGLEDAIFHMDKAISVWRAFPNPSFTLILKIAQAYYFYGWMLEENGSPKRAIEKTLKALKILKMKLGEQENPDIGILLGLTDSFYRLSKQLQKCGNVREATRHLKLAICYGRKLVTNKSTYHPRLDCAYVLLSNLLQRCGEYCEAATVDREYAEFLAHIRPGLTHR